MKFEILTDLTKKIIAQTMGATYMAQDGKLAAIESGKLIDIGQDVLDMQNGVDIFTQACIDVIGAYDMQITRYEPEVKGLYVQNWEWGAFLEVIKFAPQDLLTEDVFNLSNGKSYADVEHTFYKPNVIAKIYNERKAVAIPVSMEEERVKTAFTNYTEMARLLSGIRETIGQQRKMIIDSYAHALLGSAIAITNKATNKVRHLITEAVALGIFEEAVTPEKAMQSERFMAFAYREIATAREYMKRPTAAFNNGNGAFASGDTRLFMLNTFEKAARFGLIANTYNNGELAVGEYDVISQWQGSKSADGNNSFDFATVSSVMIAADETNKLGLGTEEVTVNNCVALLTDYRALGLTNEREKVTSAYTASADFWNDFYHLYINTLIDTDYGMVSFLLD